MKAEKTIAVFKSSITSLIPNDDITVNSRQYRLNRQTHNFTYPQKSPSFKGSVKIVAEISTKSKYVLPLTLLPP